MRESKVIAIPDDAKARTQMLEVRATVVAIGSEAWKDESQPRAKVGDKVLVAKYCGAILNGPLDGEVYRMVNDKDIYGLITAEAPEQKSSGDDEANFAAVRREKRAVGE